MGKSATYLGLNDLLHEHFTSNSISLDSDEYKSLLKGEASALKALSESSNIPVKHLNEFRSHCIEFLADEHYNEDLLDEFVEMVIDSKTFKTHISFLEELDAGVHSLERASRLNELQALEDSIEASELEAAMTSIERGELLEQLKRTEAKIVESETKVYASKPSMYREERPAAVAQIGLNRTMFMRIAAILILVLIPTSIIIYFNNSNPVTAPQKIQTAENDKKQDETADPEANTDMFMGSSPSFSMKLDIPEPEIQEMFLQISNNDDSFGFAQENDSVVIRFVSYDIQSDYLSEMKINVYNRLLEIDSLSKIEQGVPMAGIGINELDDEKVKWLQQKEMIDSIGMSNALLSNTYTYENNQITVHFHCSKCAEFNPESDIVKLIKEEGTFFLIINETEFFKIEPGIHGLMEQD